MSPWDTWAEYVSQVRNGADNGVDLPRLKHLSQLVGLPMLFVAGPAGSTLLALRITETTVEDQLMWAPIDGNTCNRPDEDPHQIEI